MSENDRERIKKLEKGIKKVEEANELLKEVKEIKELEKQLLDARIEKKRREIRALKDAKFHHRDSAGRLIRKKIFDDRGCEI